MSVYMFPGQGSQRKGMGNGLFARFRDVTTCASDILGYSIEKLCMQNPNRLLGETQYTQSATYVVNAVHYLRRCEDGEKPPSYAVGHSLGEYNALHVAGVFDFETGLRLVKKRGEAMGRIEGGGMAAVIGLTRSEVSEILTEHGLTGQIDIANDNAPTQVVISGMWSAITAAQSIFEAAPGQAGYTILNTSGAFHSRFMAGAQEQFSVYLRESSPEFTAPSIPVIANVDASEYTLDRVEDNLVRQITAPVRWTETITSLIERGERDFVEVGTGKVLTMLLDKIQTAQGIGCTTTKSGSSKELSG